MYNGLFSSCYFSFILVYSGVTTLALFLQHFHRKHSLQISILRIPIA